MKVVRSALISAGALSIAALTGVVAAGSTWGGNSQLSCQFSNSGISSLKYAGTEFLNDGDLRINSVVMQKAQGAALQADLSGARSFDAARRTLSVKYSWGSITLAYQPAGNGLTLAVTTRNNSAYPITSLSYELITLRMPAKPVEFDGVSPILGTNIGAPSVLSLTSGKTTVVMANEDAGRPLLAGFPWALNKPANTIFPLRVNIGRDPAYPNSLPAIDRPIPAGGSDTFTIGLQFAPAGTPLAQVASATYRKFAERYPFQLNWTDRRPIGLLFMARSATNWPSNPRGWLLDSAIDVRTKAGVDDLHKRVLAWADASIAVLKDANAQGMVTWDVEGEQFSQPVTYIGDPRAVATLAPEMEGILDAYFKKFRDAGLKVGLCVRPQRLMIAPDRKSAQQQNVPDPTQLLIDKIRYAQKRWGATLFYVDSNGEPSAPTDVEVIRRVAAAVPGILLIPEHKNIAYYSTSAPYNELRQGITATPQQARDIYPRAFEFIYVADGPIDKQYSALHTAVKAGDSLMFRSWYPDPANQKVKSLTASTR
jgi:hypothetical protein